MNDGLRVRLMSQDDLARSIRDRTHWALIFSGEAIRQGLVDEIDKQLAVSPTFPTIFAPAQFGPFAITLIPKSKMMRKTLAAAVIRATKQDVTPSPDEDIWVLADEADMPLIGAYLSELVGDVQEC